MVQLRMREIKSGAMFNDGLFFTEKAEWRIDTFLRAFGLAPKVGEELDFNEEFCEQRVIGARGNVSLIRVPSQKREGVFYNEVASYITNKPAPARAPKIDPADVPAAKAAPQKAQPKAGEDW
jgi:hypothetical protein